MKPLHCRLLSIAAALCLLPGLTVAQGLSPQPASPPASEFGQRLLKNTVAVFSPENVSPLILGAAFTGGAALLDDQVQGYFGPERRMKAVGEIGKYAGATPTIAAVSGALFYYSYKTENQRLRSMSFDLTQGIILSFGYSFTVKGITRRQRPDLADRISFPSGHASDSMMTAVVVSHYYPKLTVPMYAFAAFVAASRLEKNKHWLSDVAAGATLGYILGRTVTRDSDALRAGPVSFTPVIPPGGGIGVNAAICLDRAR